MDDKGDYKEEGDMDDKDIIKNQEKWMIKIFFKKMIIMNNKTWMIEISKRTRRNG